MKLRQLGWALAASLIAAPALASPGVWTDFTRNPDRVMPNPGMLVEDLEAQYGAPDIVHRDLNGSEEEVWDYGTFRSFVARGMVQRSKLW